MISDLIAAMKAIFDIAKTKSEQDRWIFAEGVKTTYEKMQEIHRDYLRSLAEIPLLTEKGFISDQLLDFVRKRRAEFEPVRSEMFGLEVEMHEFHKDQNYSEELHAFFNWIGFYFRFAASGTSSTVYTCLEELIDFINQIDRPSDEKKERLKKSVDEIQITLRGSFDEISTAYAKLKTKLLN